MGRQLWTSSVPVLCALLVGFVISTAVADNLTAEQAHGSFVQQELHAAQEIERKKRLNNFRLPQAVEDKLGPTGGPVSDILEKTAQEGANVAVNEGIKALQDKSPEAANILNKVVSPAPTTPNLAPAGSADPGPSQPRQPATNSPIQQAIPSPGAQPTTNSQVQQPATNSPVQQAVPSPGAQPTGNSPQQQQGAPSPGASPSSARQPVAGAAPPSSTKSQQARPVSGAPRQQSRARPSHPRPSSLSGQSRGPPPRAIPNYSQKQLDQDKFDEEVAVQRCASNVQNCGDCEEDPDADEGTTGTCQGDSSAMKSAKAGLRNTRGLIDALTPTDVPPTEHQKQIHDRLKAMEGRQEQMRQRLLDDDLFGKGTGSEQRDCGCIEAENVQDEVQEELGQKGRFKTDENGEKHFEPIGENQGCNNCHTLKEIHEMENQKLNAPGPLRSGAGTTPTTTGAASPNSVNNSPHRQREPYKAAGGGSPQQGGKTVPATTNQGTKQGPDPLAPAPKP